jgi:hypothetical protein
MKKTILSILLPAFLASPGLARVWTSADGSKTFEGDFISCDDKTVTVKRGFKEMTFKIELLSEADQKWAKEEQARLEAVEANREAAADFAESDFGKALKKLSKLEGGKFVDHEITEPPKFFLLYFSASW